MDLDAYAAAHEPQWRELEMLVKKSQLTPLETDRLIHLYQRAGTHLSVLRSQSPDPTLVAALSNIVAKARRRIGVVKTSTWREIGLFFSRRFPAVMYQLRWWWLGSALVSLGGAAALALWLMNTPGQLGKLLSPTAIEHIVENDFEAYYSSYAAQSFALQVWTNNALLAALCVAIGIAGFPLVIFLWNNMVNLGVMAAIMISRGRGDLFWGLILPHGLLELTAVFVAAGAGLRLFWSWVQPRNRTRLDSLAKEGRRTLLIALGLVAVLGISGVIEAFVTPSPLPTWARVGIGVLAELLFLLYVFVLGRRAVAEGEDGDLTAQDRGESVIAVD